MICLRCGYCCINYFVPIVKDPTKGVVEGNFEMHLGEGKPCRYLVGDGPGKYSCSIHHYPWFRETPCHEFGQVEASEDTPCRIGTYILNNGNSSTG